MNTDQKIFIISVLIAIIAIIAMISYKIYTNDKYIQVYKECLEINEHNSTIICYLR